MNDLPLSSFRLGTRVNCEGYEAYVVGIKKTKISEPIVYVGFINDFGCFDATSLPRFAEAERWDEYDEKIATKVKSFASYWGYCVASKFFEDQNQKCSSCNASLPHEESTKLVCTFCKVYSLL